MTLFIRSASPGDLQTISDLLGETWHATYDQIYGRDRVSEITAEWHSPAALADNLKKPNSEFVVADDGNTIAGMAYASALDGGVVMLHQLYVKPEWQGQGAGRLLLEEIIGCFADVRTIRLEVEAENAGAIAFYQRHRFKQAGQTGNCGKPDSGIAALIFERQLY